LEWTDFRGQSDPSNGVHSGRRIFSGAVKEANKQLEKRELEPLPTRLTPHSLRRTFASILFAIGEAPPEVIEQMGHTTPELTLAIYARVMARRDGEPERLKASSRAV
jgi:integrase